jgi:Rha family phage regulatory protein
VAEKFGKRHDNVIRAIRNLDCPTEFMRLNFEEHSYLDERGNIQPIYRVSRDGFAFLAMGFTGKEAASWKLKFLAAFNTMERHLMQQATERRIARDETKASLRAVSFALKTTREEAGKDTPAHVYSNEARMLNAILVELFGTDNRASLTNAQLKVLDSLQQKDMLLIAQGRTYQERKDELRSYSQRMAGTGLRLVGHPNGIAANQTLRRAA